MTKPAQTGPRPDDSPYLLDVHPDAATPPGPSRRATDRIGRMVALAVHRLSQGDDVVWDVTMAATGPGQFAPVVMVWMPAPILGQYLTASAVVADVMRSDQAAVDGVVAELLGLMRQGRSDMLNGADPLAEQGARVRADVLKTLRG